MRRVAVVGGSCAGKTTLARELAERLGVPHVELDAFNHEAEWTEAPHEVFRERVEAALAASPGGWVVDGNYRSRLGSRVLEQADTVVFLDPPFRVALWRVLRRTAFRVLRRVELWNGNRETLRNTFSRRSIVWWVITTHARYAEQIPARIGAAGHETFVHLRSGRDTRRWLQSIQATATTSGSSGSSERQKMPPSVER